MKFLAWFGHSQTGKSSSIKLLTGDKSIKCGEYGYGTSTTSDIRIYRDSQPKMSQYYYHVDTIGLGDNRLVYSESQIKKHIEMETIKLSQNNNFDSFSALIVTESFKSDTVTLSLIFQQIKAILGVFPTQSIIVLGTKKNDCNPKFAETRKSMILKTMEQYGVPPDRFLEFYTPCPDIDFTENQIDPAQYKKLEQLIHRCQNVKISSISQKRAAIQARANQIFKEKTVVETVYYDTQQVNYRTQTKSYTIQVPYEKRAGGLRGLFGGTNTRYHDVTRTEQVQVPYTVTKKVPQEVKKEPDPNYCYQLALAEFEKQLILPLAVVK